MVEIKRRKSVKSDRSFLKGGGKDFFEKIKLPEKYGIFSLFLSSKSITKEEFQGKRSINGSTPRPQKTPQTSNTSGGLQLSPPPTRFQSFVQPLPSAIWGHSISITDKKQTQSVYWRKVNTEHIQNTIYPRRQQHCRVRNNGFFSHHTSLMNNCWLLCFLVAIQMMN